VLEHAAGDEVVEQHADGGRRVDVRDLISFRLWPVRGRLYFRPRSMRRGDALYALHKDVMLHLWCCVGRLHGKGRNDAQPAN
jgi:hypothetical protein